MFANFIEEVFIDDKMNETPPLETDSEKEKLDIATGGEVIPELITDEKAKNFVTATGGEDTTIRNQKSKTKVIKKIKTSKKNMLKW